MPPVDSAIFFRVVSSRRDFTGLPFSSFAKSVPPVSLGPGHEFAGRATDTDCENLHAVLRGRLRRAYGFAPEIFAVGDQNENFVGSGARLEDCFGFVNGSGDICAAFRNHIHIKRIKRLAKGVVIERDRTLQKRAAGKGNQTNAIAVELRDEICDGEFRTREPIRLHIPG
jgi:hypothetical protein